MFKSFIFLLVFFVAVQISFCRIRLVSQYGELEHTTIQLALASALAGDTIQVMPGVYQGGFTVDKNVVIMGSGAQVTKIRYGATGYAVTLNAGKMMWFEIWGAESGIYVGTAKLSNCVVNGCGSNGIRFYQTSEIVNCISVSNKTGFYGYNSGHLPLTNCISYNNIEYNYDCNNNYGVDYCLGYSTVKDCQNYSSRVTFDTKTCISKDPLFEAGTYFKLSASSPAINTGTSGLLDPDDSPSDMGYYGGPDAPTFPIVTKIKITPNTDGTKLNIEAVGISPY
jgi:hypothetical protein